MAHEAAFPPWRARRRQADCRKSAAPHRAGPADGQSRRIDLALTVFDFGAPGFWELVQNVREAAFEAACEQDVPLLVTTFCYAEPEDRAFLSRIEEIVQRHGGELLPVFLHCSRDEALRRVGNPDRVARRKISSGEHLIRDIDRYDFTAVPRADCLRLDTSINPADMTAQEIVRHFGLGA